ncbi:iron-siderophore ABC transporter substrate-binding protein [Iamia majanohamensis]|uniref:Iron-siderophore ABC transporter substrate-binding protein n=1 Tax=Iamia majanohamensis TaxID=467976 RepID=A0AAE9YCQ6_9ACTN|nr:iron-siderophore ABC transporter substrate-binding protein [Iamia majanohamensis]WCO68788.1 iron-siderophore ABC transporter substrate-binding protein [Iamia majanohamensis]
MSRRRRGRAALAVVAVALLVLGACGGSGDEGDAEGAAAAAPADEGAFPVTIEHKYGETVVEEAPERVVSVGFTEQDSLLALGIVPVGIRDWYGDQPDATWPWAQDELGDAEPEVLSSEDINFEAVAALRPDLIVGVSSGMTDQEYDTLSEIAPTLAQTDEYVDFGTPWQDQLELVGRAVGRSDEAAALTEDLEGRFADIRAEHPELQGQEVAVSYAVSESEIGAYGTQDVRGRLMLDIGMAIPDEFDELAGDQFYSSFSLEEVERLDRDVVVWVSASDAINQRIADSPVRQQLDAVDEGREVFLTAEQAAAAGFSSPLSLPYLLDELVPMLTAAVDGDPATEVPDAL